jgi:hypothetical protein
MKNDSIQAILISLFYFKKLNIFEQLLMKKISYFSRHIFFVCIPLSFAEG